jgi:hypothetical protein
MRAQAGFFHVEERLKQLPAKRDSPERPKVVVDFELFRADLERAVPRSDRAKGGRPPFDHVLMFKTLVLQASHNLSDERTEYLIRDRLSFMRFLGLGLADTVPDTNTIWTFREALTRARLAGRPTIEVLFERFDAALSAAGLLAIHLAIGGRARLRPPEKADGSVHLHHRHCPSENQNRRRQPPLQYAPNGLAHWPSRTNLSHNTSYRGLQEPLPITGSPHP